MITGPISAIIVALIITIGTLFGVGAFEKPQHNYATVNFDGGFNKIGVISSEKIFTKAKIYMNGSIVTSGDFDDVIDWIKNNTQESSLDKTTWKNGVKLSASAGIKWIGSEASFELTTDNLNLVSTDKKPLLSSDVITKLEALESKARADRTINATQALEFGPSPNTSFLFSKVLTALQK